MPEVLSAPSASLEELRQEVERLHLLRAAGLELGASLDLDTLLPLVLERFRSSVGAGAGTVWLADGAGMLRCRSGAGEIGSRLLGAQRAWADVLEANGTGLDSGSTLAVPLVAGEER